MLHVQMSPYVLVCIYPFITQVQVWSLISWQVHKVHLCTMNVYNVPRHTSYRGLLPDILQFTNVPKWKLYIVHMHVNWYSDKDVIFDIILASPDIFKQDENLNASNLVIFVDSVLWLVTGREYAKSREHSRGLKLRVTQ